MHKQHRVSVNNLKIQKWMLDLEPWMCDLPDQEGIPSKSNYVARGEAFTDFGCIALESVIKGRISHSEAINALEMLKDCIFDRGGDLMTVDRLRMYFTRIKQPKDSVDLSAYQDEYGPF